MSLVISAAYPVAASGDEGHAVIELRSPWHASTAGTNEAVADAARQQATAWDAFACQLEAIMANGWSLQEDGRIVATRAARAGELTALLPPVVGSGTAVQWCVSDDHGSLFAVGGFLVGFDAPTEVFPGCPLPALVANELTGAQRIVDTEDELRACVREEIAASAAWWRSNPHAMSDHDGHGVAVALDELAQALVDDPSPAFVAERAGPGRLLSDAPHTRVSVHPVSAIAFAGLAEAARAISSLTLAPRDGLSGQLRARGAALARSLGVSGR